MGAENAWLGCPYSVCDLRMCPSIHSHYYANFGKCKGEIFRIVNDGTYFSTVKSGQRIRLRYPDASNSWMGCSHNNRCDKRSCSGTTSQGRDFSKCEGEIFRIYARGRTDGQTIYNGDVVMLYYISGGKYVSIQGKNEGDDTSLNFCPGQTPPTYLSYGICTKNAFRIYRKPRPSGINIT